MSEAGKVGRPSGYVAKYCDEAIRVLSMGHSLAGLAGAIGVSRQTVHNWTQQHPEFFDAVKAGQAGAVRFWEEQLVKIARDGGGNATAAIFGLKNRAADDWADRVEQVHSGEVKIEKIERVIIDPKPPDRDR